MQITVKDGNKVGTGRLISVAGRKGMIRFNVIQFFAFLAVVLFACAAPLRADDTNLEQQIQLLQQQNSVLQQQLQKQNESLGALAKKVQDLETTRAERENPSPENAAP